jgi:hypothetical protein
MDKTLINVRSRTGAHERDKQPNAHWQWLTTGEYFFNYNGFNWIKVQLWRYPRIHANTADDGERELYLKYTWRKGTAPMYSDSHSTPVKTKQFENPNDDIWLDPTGTGFNGWIKMNPIAKRAYIGWCPPADYFIVKRDGVFLIAGPPMTIPQPRSTTYKWEYRGYEPDPPRKCNDLNSITRRAVQRCAATIEYTDGNHYTMLVDDENCNGKSKLPEPRYDTFPYEPTGNCQCLQSLDSCLSKGLLTNCYSGVCIMPQARRVTKTTEVYSGPSAATAVCGNLTPAEYSKDAPVQNLVLHLQHRYSFYSTNYDAIYWPGCPNGVGWISVNTGVYHVQSFKVCFVSFSNDISNVFRSQSSFHFSFFQKKFLFRSYCLKNQ